jgi:hypothetical protein
MLRKALKVTGDRPLRNGLKPETIQTSIAKNKLLVAA